MKKSQVALKFWKRRVLDFSRYEQRKAGFDAHEIEVLVEEGIKQDF